jgi:hypothetical protein
LGCPIVRLLLLGLLILGDSVVLCSGGFLGGISEGFCSLLLFVGVVFSRLDDGNVVPLPPGMRDPE